MKCRNCKHYFLYTENWREAEGYCEITGEDVGPRYGCPPMLEDLKKQFKEMQADLEAANEKISLLSAMLKQYGIDWTRVRIQEGVVGAQNPADTISELRADLKAAQTAESQLAAVNAEQNEIQNKMITAMNEVTATCGYKQEDFRAEAEISQQIAMPRTFPAIMIPNQPGDDENER